MAIKSIAAFGAGWLRLWEILAGTGLLPMLQPQVFAIVTVGRTKRAAAAWPVRTRRVGC
ncbi:hypothetical protein BQ8794_20026 [Mesorhizobium prunaredense]|uniref:Uncharacterized protein n=1 Tax=Mesorhizobium prunaredense TaxID=1631249 RepID=A0A1R3V571_9HYPH|nr:hypothetical protein BQ8794_20026 [Mesorhizobium prunaredense]